jgi:hypothetical protein
MKLFWWSCVCIFFLQCKNSPSEDQSGQVFPEPLVHPMQTVQAKSVEPEEQANKNTTDNHGPKIDFAELRFNFGNIYHADKVKHEFQFTNTGDRDLEIKGARASCGCTTPSYPLEPIRPGEKGAIAVTYNSVGKQGAQKATIRVATNDPVKPEVVLHLSGRVLVKPKAEEKDHH